MRNHEETVQDTESQCRYREEVHRSNRFSVIIQKGRPALRWFGISWSLPHPTQNSSLRDIEAEHLQFAVKSRRSQVRFSATILKMSSRSSLLTHFLPAPVRCRESHFQYILNPARCQRTTVSGLTKINACFHPDQSCRIATQNNLFAGASCGTGRFFFKAVSC
jgi:hypothetical protein